MGGLCRCDCSYEIAKGKAPGPDGPKTLCAACGSRFRAGHSGPPKKDDDGMYICPTCHKRFGTIPALGGHRRYCDPTGKHDSLHNDDLELFSETLILDQLKLQKAAALSQQPPTYGEASSASSTSTGTSTDKAGVVGEKNGEAVSAAADKAAAAAEKENESKEVDVGDLTVTTDPMMLPPPPTVLKRDTSDTFDVLSFVDWLHRFSKNVGLPILTVKQVFTLLEGHKPVEGVQPDIVAALHIKLVRILIEEMDEPTEMYYHVDMRIAKSALDEITWPEVLRLRVSPLEDSAINDAIREAADAILINGYDACTIKQKLCVLGYLVTEVLSTSEYKELIDDAQDQVEKIDQDKMRFGMDKKRKANEKEVEKWVGRRVALSCGNLGVVESGSRGVFRVKLDNPEGMVGIKIGKPAEQQVEGSKRDKGGICIRRPAEMRFADAAVVLPQDGTNPSTVGSPSPTPSAMDTSTGDFGDDNGQEEDLQLTPQEEAEQAEQDALLEQLSIRTEPLGQDRFFNLYWWFPSHPGKLYIEDHTCYGHYPPLNVKAFVEAKAEPKADQENREDGDGKDSDHGGLSIAARRVAANQAVRAHLEGMKLEDLRNYVDAAKIPAEQLENIQTKQQIVEAIMSGPLAFKMQPLSVSWISNQ